MRKDLWLGIVTALLLLWGGSDSAYAGDEEDVQSYVINGAPGCNEVENLEIWMSRMHSLWPTPAKATPPAGCTFIKTLHPSGSPALKKKVGEYQIGFWMYDLIEITYPVARHRLQIMYSFENPGQPI